MRKQGPSRLVRLVVSTGGILVIVAGLWLYSRPGNTVVLQHVTSKSQTVTAPSGPVLSVDVPTSKPKPNAKATASPKKTTAAAKATAKASGASTKKIVPVPVPANTIKMSLLLRTRAVGNIPATGLIGVGTISVQSRTMVQPPEPSGSDWMNTSVRVAQAAYPSYPSAGTTYVYGHACWFAGSKCPFTAVKKTATGFTVQAGDKVIVGTPTGVLTYTVTRVGESPKHHTGSLPSWASDSTVPNRIVVVTCDESVHPNGHALDNIIIVGTLTASARR